MNATSVNPSSLFIREGEGASRQSIGRLLLAITLLLLIALLASPSIAFAEGEGDEDITNIDAAVIRGIPVWADCTGWAIEPEVTVTLGDKLLTAGQDYVVAYSDNVQPGFATVEVSGVGSYGGSVIRGFNIIERATFQDVAPNSWLKAEGWLDYVVQNHIMSGYGDDDWRPFGPEGVISREMFAVVLCRMAQSNGADVDGAPDAGFTDVSEYATTGVNWCVNAGVMQGRGDEGGGPVFGADKIVSRQEAADALHRLCTSCFGVADEAAALTGFSDASDVDEGFVAPVAWCAAKGMFSGEDVADGKIKPNAPATRAFLAKALTITMQLAQGPTDDISLAAIGVSCKIAGLEAEYPSVYVSYAGERLVEGQDYDVSFVRNDVLGTALAVVTGKGSYEGTFMRAYDVLSQDDERIKGNDPMSGGGDSADYADAAKEAGFSDLAAGAWYMSEGFKDDSGKVVATYLDYTIGRGLMSGYTGERAGQFGPDDALSRGMAATIIYRMATGATASTTDNAVDAGFADVGRGEWYAAAVKWCAEKGVVTGYAGTGRFGPDDRVTREQLAAMVFRYCTQVAGMAPAGEDVSRFPDGARIAEWARAAAAFCAEHGVITGKSDTGAFDPQGDATRCQMAKIIAVTARLVE